MKRFLQNLFGQPKTIRKPRRFQPQLEGLEDRRLMAGDVSAYISGGTLYINGDNANNNIEIYQQADNSVRIVNTEPYLAYTYSYSPYMTYTYTQNSSLSNSYYTLIDGAFSKTITGSFSNMRVNMSGGNDTVKIRDVDVDWDLSVDLGGGYDYLTVKNVTTRDDLQVWTGGGGTATRRDVIDISDTYVGSTASSHDDLAIYGTTGVEEVRMRNVTVEDDMYLLLTKQGEYDRALLYSNVNVGIHRFNLGYQFSNAQIQSDYVYANDMDVVDDGDFSQVNRLYLYNSDFGRYLFVNGTSKYDTMYLYYNSVGLTADIDTLDGNDSVAVYGSTGVNIDGGNGNDTLRGGDGNDTIYGGIGNDSLIGRNGDDLLYGDADNDYLFGGDGRDRLFGEWGNDTLEGGSGDDFLNGGSNNDKLLGQDGFDALYGSSGSDTLYGGADADRFLMLRNPTNNDAINDYTSADRRIYFENYSQVNVPLNGLNFTTFSAGAWTDQNIEWVDDAFYVMVQRTGNNGLIRPDMVFGRVGNNLTGNGFTAYNFGFGSVFSNAVFENQNKAMRTVFHEVGHDWDNENPYWSNFMAISGWTQVAPASGTGYTQGNDFQWAFNQWWYKSDKSNTFARDYGKTNPMEDFATNFAKYFMDWGGSNTEYTFLSYGYSSGDVSDKQDLIDNWLDEV